MIGWAPLEPLDEPPVIIKPLRPIQKFDMFSGSTETECNYLVLFFIIGVLGLALKDMLAK
jgi:hypothetical protein